MPAGAHARTRCAAHACSGAWAFLQSQHPLQWRRRLQACRPRFCAAVCRGNAQVSLLPRRTQQRPPWTAPVAKRSAPAQGPISSSIEMHGPDARSSRRARQSQWRQPQQTASSGSSACELAACSGARRCSSAGAGAQAAPSPPCGVLSERVWSNSARWQRCCVRWRLVRLQWPVSRLRTCSSMPAMRARSPCGTALHQ